MSFDESDSILKSEIPFLVLSHDGAYSRTWEILVGDQTFWVTEHYLAMSSEVIDETG